MKRKPAKTKGITNLILLQHIQAMRFSLEERMDRIEGRTSRVEGRLDKIEERLDRIEKNIIDIKDALQRLYSHRVNMLIRIERLEKAVGIAA